MCLMSAPHLFCGKTPPSLGHCEGPKPSFSLPVNLGRGHCLKASVGRPWGGGVRPSKDGEEACCSSRHSTLGARLGVWPYPEGREPLRG